LSDFFTAGAGFISRLSCAETDELLADHHRIILWSNYDDKGGDGHHFQLHCHRHPVAKRGR
jgi:hypothetical protein